MRIDLDKLASHIKPQVERLVEKYIPNAKRQGNGWRLGNPYGERGDSCWIGPIGFHDHSTQENGSHLTLFANCMGKTIQEAAQILAKETGFVGEANPMARKRSPHRTKINYTNLTENHKNFLREERGFDVALCEKLPMFSNNQQIIFQHEDVNGDNYFTKIYNLGEKKGRQWYADEQAGDTVHMPWLVKYVTENFPNADRLYICEGQWDAIAALQAGFPAIAIPNGAGNHQWFDEAPQFINSFSEIVLCYDNDPAGQQALEGIAGRFTKPLYTVELPEGWDLNDSLIAEGVDGLAHRLSEASPYSPPEIIVASSLMERAAEGQRSLFEWTTPWDDRFKFRMRASEYTVLTAYTGHGKALALDTLVQTTEGLIPMGLVKPGMRALTPNGGSSKIIAESEIFTDHDCYLIEFDNGAHVIADAGHKWRVDDEQCRAYGKGCQKIITTEEMFHNQRNTYDQRLKYSIPIAKPNDTGTSQPEIPGYTLGAWLGDGASASGSIYIQPKDKRIISIIRGDGYKVKKHSSKYGWGIHGIKKQLSKLGVLNRKQIPEEALAAPMEYRVALLQGMMDTDGSISGGVCEFTNTNRTLAYQFLRLACSLNIKARIHEGVATLNGQEIGPKYRITFTTKHEVFRLPRKKFKLRKKGKLNPVTKRIFIKKVTKTKPVPVKCIEIEDPEGMFLITEQAIPTHNSNYLRQMVTWAVHQHGAIPGIASFEDTPLRLTSQVMESLRDHPDIQKILDRIHMFDASHPKFNQEKVTPEQVLSVFRQLHQSIGANLFIIDNLMCLKVSRENYQDQADVAELFRQFVLSLPVHLILVAHPRKPPPMNNNGKLTPPDPYEIKGAGEIADAAWNVLSLIRNIPKEREIDHERMHGMGNPEEKITQIDMQKPDSILQCQKQRWNGFLPTIWHWRDAIGNYHSARERATKWW